MNTDIELQQPKIRLGYVVPEFPGQTHTFFWREIEELERQGVDVHLISTRRPPRAIVSHDWSEEAINRTRYLLPVSIGSVLKACIRFPKVILQVVKLDPKIKKADRLFGFLIAMPLALELVRWSRGKQLDHIHVHSCAKSALIAMLAHEMGGPTYSLTLHGGLSSYGPHQPLKWARAAFGSTVTEKTREELFAKIGEDDRSKIYVEAMGIDSEFFTRDAPYTPWNGKGILRLFSCGRLNKGKGHLETISLVADMTQSGLSVHLYIAGEDEQGGSGFRKQIEHQISEKGLQDHVFLLGSVSETEVRSQLQKAHVFLLPSWNEAIGVAYMEAMSMEVPVIGTTEGGVTELITDGKEGLLVPPKNVGALRKALMSIAENPDAATRMGKAGAERVRSDFGSDRSASALIDAIDRHVCSGSKSPE